MFDPVLMILIPLPNAAFHFLKGTKTQFLMLNVTELKVSSEIYILYFSRCCDFIKHVQKINNRIKTKINCVGRKEMEM